MSGINDIITFLIGMTNVFAAFVIIVTIRYVILNRSKNSIDIHVSDTTLCALISGIALVIINGIAALILSLLYNG